MKSRLAKGITGIVLLAASLPSTGALIGVQDHGTYFSDTQSGLDWLDVTASVNKSYNYVSTQFGSGGEYEGWQYATAAQFGSMWGNITGEALAITGLNQRAPGKRGAIIGEVIDLLGDTVLSGDLAVYGAPYCSADRQNCPSNYRAITTGILANPSVIIMGQQYRAYAYIDDNNWSSVSSDIVATDGSVQAAATSHYFGSFLVRTTYAVPSPSVIALLGIGLVGIGFSRRKVTNS